MRTRLFSTAWIVALMLALFAAGCGDDDSATSGGAAATTTATKDADAESSESEEEKAKESEEEKAKDAEEEGEKAPCKADATSEATGLPDSFPLPDGVTITKVEKDGPTTVLEGYWAVDLDEAYDEYGIAVEKAGYTVLAKEHEAHDAEINYKGAKRQGQIALRETCSESETTRVRITNRPE
jgi:hypothetical protein